MRFYNKQFKILLKSAVFSSQCLVPCSQRTFCILNQKYWLFKAKNPLKFIELRNSLSHRDFSTPLAERFTIFNPEFNQYLKGLEDELQVMFNLSNEEKSKYGKSRVGRVTELQEIIYVSSMLRGKANELNEILSLGETESDKEIKAMVEEDSAKCRKEIEVLEKELVNAIVGEVKTDRNDIIIELTAGVGGTEAMLFTKDIYDMYIQYIDYKGWQHEVLDYDTTDQGGLRKAKLEVNGENVFKYMKYEGGVHRVQRVPQTERSGRMHTSTMAVAILPQPSEIDIVIGDKDLKIQTFRAQGAGGQHVNKTDSAVRIIHLPTGTAVECQEERSQIENKKRALKTLRAQLYQKELEAQLAETSNARKIQVGTGGRSEKIRTYNFQQNRVTDHRVHVNLPHLDNFLKSGEALDDLLQILIQNTKYKTLQALVEEYSDNLKKQKHMKC